MHNNEFVNVFSGILRFINAFFPIFFWILLIYGFDDATTAGLTVISAVIHELGHFLFYLLKEKKFRSFKGVIGGLKIVKKHNLSYPEEFSLCILGPLANFIAFLISFIVVKIYPGEYLSLFSTINLLVGLSGMIPIEGYDGYGAILAIMKLFGCSETAFIILKRVSFGLIIVLTFLSLITMLLFDGWYWIYAVFSVLLYENVSGMLKSTFSEN